MVWRELKLGLGALFSSSVSLGTCSRKVIVVAKCQSHTPVLLAHHTGILLLIPYYCCKFTTSLSPTISNTHKLVYTFFFFNSVSFLHSTDNPKLHLVMLQTSALKSSWEFKQIKCTREKSEIKKITYRVVNTPHKHTHKGFTCSKQFRLLGHRLQFKLLPFLLFWILRRRHFCFYTPWCLLTNVTVKSSLCWCHLSAGTCRLTGQIRQLLLALLTDEATQNQHPKWRRKQMDIPTCFF